jgi:hypothetical protein
MSFFKSTSLFTAIIFSLNLFAQEDKKNFTQDVLSHLSGSLESNITWYNNDPKFPNSKAEINGEYLRSNSYLRLDYEFLNNFTAGLQIESYEPMALLRYYEGYEGTDLATYYVNYKNESLEITAGYFYEQFGSGLLLRAYEERQLGWNNALRGGRVIYTPNSYLSATALYGQMRNAFEISDSNFYGVNTNFDITNAFNIETINNLSLGLSYVGKQEDFSKNPDFISSSNTPNLINSYAVNLDADFGKFYTSMEYTIKGEDIGYKEPSLGTPLQPVEDKFYKGNALLVDLGYTKKGIGINTTFRRIENMSFFAESGFSNPDQNEFNMLSVNYIPALSKQQDFALGNIYVYQPQARLSISENAGQAGEIGSQIDAFYTIKKGTALGGKYGTKLTANFSYWALLDAKFNAQELTYDAEFLKFGKKLFKDFNIEMRKKWSKTWSSIFTFQNGTINKGVFTGESVALAKKDVDFTIAVAEVTYKFGKGKSIRLEAQHLWSESFLETIIGNPNGNWAGGTIEVNLNRNLSLYANDIYNYDNYVEDYQIHYYNFGGSYSKGATRIALNYGRQRGGLLCVGGVCRVVTENTGLSLNLTTAF